MSRRHLIVALLLALPLAAQQPAVEFAKGVLETAFPAHDDADRTALDRLRCANNCPREPYAWYLVQQVLEDRHLLQRPAELLPVIEGMLGAGDLHGSLRNELRWLRYWLRRAGGDAVAAASDDPSTELPRTFVAVGPFGDNGDRYQGVPFPPELAAFDHDSRFSGRFGEVRPRVVTRRAFDSVVSVRDPRRDQPGCFYLLHRVEVQEPVQGRLRLWCRGGLQVFVNGVEIGRPDPAQRGGEVYSLFPLALQAGCNHVLIKTTDNGSADLYLNYVDAAGNPLAGLREIDAAQPITAAAEAGELPAAPDDDLHLLLTAAAGLQGDEQRSVLLAAATMSGIRAAGDVRADVLDRLTPSEDPLLQLAHAQLWRLAPDVPDEMANSRARELVEAAAKTLPASHSALLQARVQLLEEADQREQALRLLWTEAREGRAGTTLFPLLREVANRARFVGEEWPILERWQQCCPGDARPRVELARLCARAGAYPKAREHGLAALRLRPDRSQHLGDLVEWTIDAGDAAAARELVDLALPAALETDGGLSRLRWRAFLAHRTGQVDDLLQCAAAIETHPSADAALLKRTGEQLLAADRGERALSLLQQSLALDADQLSLRATVARLQGEPEPGAVFERFRRDSAAALAAFQAGPREDAAPATALIDQMLVEVFADGSQLSEIHQLRRLNDPSGVEEHKEASGPAAARDLLALRTVGKDGQDYVPVRVNRTFSMPRIEPGAFVEWRYREQHAAPGAAPLRTPQFLFRSDSENYLLSELVMVLPADPKFELRVRNFPTPPEVIELGDGRRAMRFVQRDAERLPPEENRPPLAELVPAVAGGVDDSVNAELRESVHGSRRATRPTPALRAQAARLIADRATAAERAAALHAFCQQEIANGDRSTATETLLRRKGNRQWLLLALLEAAGFTIEPGLCESSREDSVENDGDLFRNYRRYYDLPCARVHAEGMEAFWWFPDTPRHYPLGGIPAQRARGAALLHTEAGVELLRLPDTVHAGMDLHATLTAELQDGGDMQAKVELGFLGVLGYDLAERLRQSPANQRRQAALRILQPFFPEWQIREAELAPLDPPGKPVGLAGRFRHAAVQQDGDRHLLPLPLPRGQLLANFGDRPGRQAPLRLTADVHQVHHIELATGPFRCADLPASTRFSFGPLDYQQEFRHDGGRLVIHRELRLRPATIPPWQYADWLQVLQAIDRAETQNLVLTER